MHFMPRLYLDPGSGSFLIQLAVAAVLGLAVAIRAYWGSIKKMLGFKSKPTEDDDESENK